MTALLLPKPFRKILVVGPIYDQMEKLSKVESMLPQYDWTIFNGGLCYPATNLSELQNRIHKMDNLIQTGKVIYIVSGVELTILKQIENESWLSAWITSKPNIVLAEYPSRTVIITSGGIPLNVTKKNQLEDNIETSFVSNIRGVSWHKWYSGGLGYVISNNPLTETEPDYHSYSLRLGNSYSSSAQVYAQEVDELGLKQTISL